MSRATSLDIDVNVNLNVSYDTAQTCLRILNIFLKNNHYYRLSENEIPVDCSNVKLYQYDMLIPF